MPDPIVAVDTSEVREGTVEELKRSMEELVDFVDENEPAPIAYSVYLNEREGNMTVVQVHPDSASMEHHMDVAGPLFAKLSEFVTLLRVDIYGQPSEDLVVQMEKKAGLLGNAAVTVHRLHAGFIRIPSSKR